MPSLAPLHRKTPLVLSEPLSARLDTPVWLKLDCLQPVGSFKIRGIGRKCQTLVAAGARRLVGSSGGNAGYALAYAARALDVPATIVVPRTTPEFMRARIRDLGADVVEHGASWDDAHVAALERSAGGAAGYVHPFDDPEVWAGHASVIDEVAGQGPRPRAIVVAVGGGGLLCGILEGLHRAGWHDVPIVAVETEGAASFHAAVAAGRPVALDAIRSLATTLGARRVTPKLLEWKARHGIEHWLATDRQAVDACLRFLDDHRLLVEPACGAALAAAYERCPHLVGGGPVLIEVCGGAGVSLELLAQWDRSAPR
jgi:L-serine/L-threonine ammonia-lyase